MTCEHCGQKLVSELKISAYAAAALSLLSYPADQAAQVMDDNLTSDFRLLFPDPRSTAICWPSYVITN